MKWLIRVVGGVLVLVVGVFVLQVIASETGEVVVLKTHDDAGELVETRLWVVDHENAQYLRAGPGSGWYLRLVAKPEVWLTRAGATATYAAAADLEARAEINRRMREKYAWRDQVVEMLVGREDAIPVRLTPR